MSAVTVLCAPRDEAFAKQIADALARKGHNPRRPSGAFHEGPLALDDDAAIVVWSNAALRIARLHSQARQALERGSLVPVAVGGAIPPGEFEALPPIDLSGWRGEESDPRWKFVLEEIEIASLRQKQGLADHGAFAPVSEEALYPPAGRHDAGALEDAPPAERFSAYTPGVEDAPVAAPKRARRRSRFNPYAVAISCGAALAALTGAAVMLTPASVRGPSAADAGAGTLAIVEASPETAGLPDAAPPAEETPSDFEITVSREPQELSSGDLDGAAAESLAGGVAEGEAVDADSAAGDGAEVPPLEKDEAGLALPDLESAAGAESNEETQATAEGGPDVAAMDRLFAEVGAEAPDETSEEDLLSEGDAEGYFRDCKACPQMARIPAGSFAMGSPQSEPARQASEGPRREVAIPRDFAMGAREVTFAEWDACVADGGCRAYKPYDHGWGRGERPVVNVSFEDAKAYAQWLSEKTGATYRLPSEAEWEYAARAGAKGPFAFNGTLTPQKANYNAKYPYAGEPAEPRGMTTPAGTFPPNGFGLYDMHGNVWEWTADCWADTLAAAPADGSPLRGDCARRALKGGAWNTGGWRLRSAHRIGKTAAAREFDNGFRVVRELD